MHSRVDLSMGTKNRFKKALFWNKMHYLVDFVVFIPKFIVLKEERRAECEREEVSRESRVPFVAADFETFEAAIFCAGITPDPFGLDIEADAVFASELDIAFDVKIGWGYDAGKCREGVDISLGIEPIGGDGARSIGTVEAMQIDGVGRGVAHDIDDLVDLQEAGSKRKTVEVNAEFLGAFFDFRGESVEADDRRDSQGFKLVEIVCIGHGTDVKGIDVAKIARQSLSAIGKRDAPCA